MLKSPKIVILVPEKDIDKKDMFLIIFSSKIHIKIDLEVHSFD